MVDSRSNKEAEGRRHVRRDGLCGSRRPCRKSCSMRKSRRSHYSPNHEKCAHKKHTSTTKRFCGRFSMQARDDGRERCCRFELLIFMEM